MFKRFLLLTAILCSHASVSAQFGSLPYMYGNDPVGTHGYVNTHLGHWEQEELRDFLIREYEAGTRKRASREQFANIFPVDGLRRVTPQTNIAMLSDIAPGIHRTDIARHLIRLVLVSIPPSVLGFRAWKKRNDPRIDHIFEYFDYDKKENATRVTGSHHPSRNPGTAAGLLAILPLISLARLAYKCSGIHGTYEASKLPFWEKILNTSSIGRVLKREITGDPDLPGRTVRNGGIARLATAALSLERDIARNEKIRIALVVLATIAVVAVSATALYKLVGAISNKVSGRSYALGASATAGVLGLLQASPLITPVLSERLKRLQTQYRNLRAQLHPANK